MPGAEDRALLVSAVREAGALALEAQRKGVRARHKPDGTLVTDIDLAVDRLLKDRLHRARPAFGWLSEESPDDHARIAATFCWIADPIDGTRDFAHGGSDWCIGVALCESGRAVLSCLLQPRIDLLFEAALGQGATCNGAPLVLVDGPTLAGARAMGTRKLTDHLLPHGVSVVAADRVPLLTRLAMLSRGELDVVVSTGPKNDWDLAPGALLVTEAGGIVTDTAGAAHCYNGYSRQQGGLVAASAARHKAILNALEHP